MQRTLDHPTRSVSAIRRTPLDFAGIFAGLLLIVILAGVLFWQFWHTERIFTGVSVDGVPVGGLTRAGAINRLNQQLGTAPMPPVSLTYGGEAWPLDADALRAETDLLAAVDEAYRVGRTGAFGRRFSEQLVAGLRGADLTPARAIDTGQLRYAVDGVAREVRQPARPATRTGETLIPGQPGMDVDVETTVNNVLTALAGQQGRAPLTVSLAAIPLLPPAEPVALVDAASGSLSNEPLLLSDSGSGMDLALDAAQLDEIIYTRDPLRIDRDALAAVLTGWAAQIDVPAREARLRFDPATGNVTVVQSSRTGRALDVEATVAAVERALVEDRDQAELVIAEVAPLVDSNRVAEMGIRELVASGVSYFSGSSADRIRNIEVAAEKMDGVVIPPGEIFSFNQYVEDVSAANGFEDSLIIWGDRTAVGVGGGVCQVSTTLFRAAYEAGLPIVERYNHGYVVDWYGEPGFDATIYTPTVDFRFRNDTDNYLLVQPDVNSAGGVITFNLYGTKPDRQVTISEPIVTNQQEPEAPSYQVDETLAQGEIEQVEWPKEGMTVVVERTIVEGGETRTDTLTSQYQPWQAVYLIGPDTPVPDGE